MMSIQLPAPIGLLRGSKVPFDCRRVFVTICTNTCDHKQSMAIKSQTACSILRTSIYVIIIRKGFLTSKSLKSCRLMDDDMINKPSQLSYIIVAG